MNHAAITVRFMEAEDLEVVVAIDGRVLGSSRWEYYETKFERLFESQDSLPTSLVAVDQEGTLIGFVMGQLFIGEYGIFRDEASLDTIGIDPQHQHKGIGERLVSEFMDHLRELGVQKVNTLVDQEDTSLISFFKMNQFGPSNTINLERKL